jgi:hypothetical protein
LHGSFFLDSLEESSDNRVIAKLGIKGEKDGRKEDAGEEDRISS